MRSFLLPTLCAFFLSMPVGAEEEKWVSLFNGKDLTGWKTHPSDKAKWEVKDGLIVGTGTAGHLFSDRGTYKNFRYRVEASISDKGNSGQYFRAQFGRAFPKGLEAQINSTGGDPVKTGSLYNVVKVLDRLVEPDTFFVQEVIAKDNHIIIKVNGKVTVDTKLTGDFAKLTEGHFAIQQHDPGSTVKVKRIEVIELP